MVKGESPSSDIISSWLHTLKTDSNKSNRHKSLFNIGGLDKETIKKSSEIIPTLLSCLKNDSDPGLRAESAQTLSYLNHKEAAEALIKAMSNDRDGIVGLHAARALGTYELPEVIPALVRTMQQDIFHRVRSEAAYSLGQIGNESAIPFLVEIIKNDEIYFTAATALYYIHSSKAVTSLINLLNIEDSNKLSSIINALELLGKKAQKATPLLCKIARNHFSSWILAKAIYALGYFDGKEANSFIQDQIEKEEDAYILFWYALTHARLFGKESKGAELLIKFFAVHHMDDDQINEYRLLHRKWFYEDEKKEKSTKEQEKTKVIMKQIMLRESKKVEFKSYLRWNKGTKQVSKELEFKIAKTLSAFMNSEGGTLFIGVNDKGGYVGIEKDMPLLM
ncbi:MAG: HEAT repeat domain-containing protein [Candidatus Heimdallarchaeota archaeon]